MRPDNVFDLAALIRAWVDQEAERHDTKCDWVDLRYEKDLTKEREKEQNKHHNRLIRYQAAVTVVERKGAKQIGQGRRDDQLSKSTKVGGDAKITHKESISETVFEEHAVSFTKQFSGGFSLGVSYYVDLGFNFDMSFSKTTTKTHSKEATITKEQEFELEAGKRYQITKDVFEIHKEEDIQLAINLVGVVPVHFKKPVKLPDRDGKHQFHFIPITTVTDGLKKSNLLPNSVVYRKDNETAILTVEAQHTFKVFEADIQCQCIENNLSEEDNKKAQSEGTSSDEEKQKEKKITITGQGKIELKVANIMSALNMSREGFQKMHKETPDLALLLLNRTLPADIKNLGRDKKNMLGNSLMEQLGVDNLVIKDDAKVGYASATQMSEMHLHENPSDHKSALSPQSVTASDAFKHLLNDLLSERKGYRFMLTRPNPNILAISVIETKEGALVMPNMLSTLIERLKSDFAVNDLSPQLKQEPTKLTITGDSAVMDAVAALLRQASGAHMSADYVKARQHTGFFSWTNKSDSPKNASESKTEDNPVCAIQ